MAEGASVLFVRGGPETMRTVFRRHGFGYWSAGFDCILEKHGWLDFDVADHGALAQPKLLRQYDLLLIGWIPEEVWKPAYLQGLWSYDGVVFLEGPVPQRLVGFAGLELEDGPASQTGELRFARGLEEIVDSLRHLASPGRRLSLRPAAISTGPPGVATAGRERLDSRAEALAAYALAYQRRFENNGFVFSDTTDNALAALAFARFASKLPEGELRRNSEEIARRMWAPEHAASAEASWSAVLADAADAHELERVASALGDAPNGTLPALLEGKRVLELLVLAAVLERRGESSASAALFDACLVEAYEEEGFRNAAVVDGYISADGRMTASPLAMLALVDGTDEIALRDAASLASAAYSPAHLEGWRRTAYHVQAARPIGCRELVTLVSDQGEEPLLVRRGRVLASTFQLLAHAVQAHTAPPLPGPLTDVEAGAAAVLEHVLFGVLRETMNRFERTALEVAPWPWGRRYCLVLRHDVDRIPERAAFERLLELERERGIRSTWCWMSDRVDRALIEKLEVEGHEIALHARSLRDKRRELEALGRPVAGESLHGATDSDYWLGYSSVEAAIEQGLAYTELARAPDLPYGVFPRLEPDGVVERERIIGLTSNFTTDGGGRSLSLALPDDPDALDVLRRHARAGLLCSVMNHPDLSFERLRTWLDALPEGGSAWTAAEVAAWWSSTHSRDALRMRKIEDTRTAIAWRLVSRDEIADVELRTGLDARVVEDVTVAGEDVEWVPLEPAGIRIRVHLRRNEPVTVRVTRSRQPRYEEVVELMRPVGSVDPDADYMLRRVSKMAEVVGRFTPYPDHEDLSVGDVGCGYGPFTLAFHLGERPTRMTAFDANSAYVQEGARLVRELGIERVSFSEGDMTSTDEVISGIDLLIVNNSINYLTTRRGYVKAIRSFARALKPGGALVILTPNRLYPRERFTELVGVQWMPKPLANWYVRRRGRRDTYADIRLPSPFELMRWLRRAGFAEVQVVDAFGLDTDSARRYYKPRFYVTAWKP